MVIVDDFAMDVAVRETHAYEAEITDKPTESGSTISDHRRRKPFSLTLECVVSDTPPDDVAATRSTDDTPSRAALAHLLGIDLRSDLVTIITSKNTYDNMGLESLEVNAEAEKTGGLFFTAKFKEVRIVVNARAPRASVPRGQGKGNFSGGRKASDGKLGERQKTASEGGLGLAGRSNNPRVTNTYFWRKAIPTPENAGGALGPPGTFPTEIISYFSDDDSYRHGNGEGLSGMPAPGTQDEARGEFAAFTLDMERDRREAYAKQKSEAKRVGDFTRQIDENNKSKQYTGPDQGAAKIDRGSEPIHIPKDWASSGKK